MCFLVISIIYYHYYFPLFIFLFFLALLINCMAVNLGIQFLILDIDKSVLYSCQADIKISFTFRDSSGFKLAVLLFVATASPLPLTTSASPPAGKAKLNCK